MRELLPCRLPISTTLREETEVKTRHRERRIEVQRHVVMTTRGCSVSRRLATEGEQVVRAGIELVEAQQRAGHMLCFHEPPGMDEQHGV